MAANPNLFVSFYKIFRWIVPVVGIVAILMALGRPPRPSLPMTSQAAKEQAKSFEQKWGQLSSAQSTETHFTSDEVTADLSQQLGAPVGGITSPAAGQPQNPELSPNSEVPENTPLRDVNVDFHGDQFTGQVTANIHGKDIYITISGRVGSKDGYATVEPTSIKVGDLTIPVSLVNGALQKKLADPENREKLKLPDNVESLRIENGELVMEEKKN